MCVVTWELDLNFISHIKTFYGRNNGLLATIKANFPSVSIALLIKLFQCYVHLILEFGTGIWNPHMTKDQTSGRCTSPHVTNPISFAS